MRKTETFIIGGGLLAVLVVIGGVLWTHNFNTTTKLEYTFPTTKYGAFLAAQHAIYVNDFERAAEFTSGLQDVEYATVRNTRYLSEFLSGRLPEQAKSLEKEKSTPAMLIYDAYLITQDKWDDLYKRHKKDSSALAAPLRIWSSVATGKGADALKFIDSLPTNSSWKAFVRGQIMTETGDITKAADEFTKVSPDFMNISDYLYLMSFYKHNDMQDAAVKLKKEFTARPGGMFMLDYDSVPDWSVYSGHKNQLGFSLVQNVSHTQVMMYSDLAVLLLRFSEITAPKFGRKNDAINYYLGQFFFNNSGNYEKHFNKIKTDSPFYLFASLRDIERKSDIKKLIQITNTNPLFIPATNKLVAYYIKTGDQRAALRIIDTALNTDNLPDTGRAYFLKGRAQINFAFNDLNNAQSDIHEAAKILLADADILSLQAKIWAAQNRELDNAYEYAMTIVRQNPTDVVSWNTLGRVIAARDGAPAALEILKRVGEISNSCSSLFDNLGDLYLQIGDKELAGEAYQRAIELADDGFVVVPIIEKKLRKLK